MSRRRASLNTPRTSSSFRWCPEREDQSAGRRNVRDRNGRSWGDLVENDPTFHTDVDRRICSTRSPGKPVLVVEFAGHAGLPRASPRTRTACFTAWATTRKTRSRWMASPSPTSRARSFPTRFRSIRLSPWKSSRGAAGRVRRQDQRGDQRDHALRPGRQPSPLAA